MLTLPDLDLPANEFVRDLHILLESLPASLQAMPDNECGYSLDVILDEMSEVMEEAAYEGYAADPAREVLEDQIYMLNKWLDTHAR